MSTIINATTTNGVVIQPDNSGSLVLQTNSGTTAVTIDTSQNVGIGTATMTGKFNVTVASNAAFQTASYFTNAIDADVYTRMKTGVSDIGCTTSTPLTFSTASTERMRIDSSGNVLVNTTSVVNGSKLSVSGGATNVCIGSYQATASSIKHITFSNTNNEVGSISTSGTSTAFTTSSDYRLKEDVAPMAGALDTVAALKPVTYKWKVDGTEGQGFIAHELAEVVPDCVTGEKDAVDAKGNPIYQGIDTSFLVATLTAAIQEQQTIINDLKARVETLEAK